MSQGAEANLKTILALCDNPYWTAQRRWRIRDLAQAALKDVQYYKQLNPTIRSLDDEVESGCTDD